MNQYICFDLSDFFYPTELKIPLLLFNSSPELWLPKQAFQFTNFSYNIKLPPLSDLLIT
jgi:hypothetical protein